MQIVEGIFTDRCYAVSDVHLNDAAVSSEQRLIPHIACTGDIENVSFDAEQQVVTALALLLCLSCLNIAELSAVLKCVFFSC